MCGRSFRWDTWSPWLHTLARSRLWQQMQLLHIQTHGSQNVSGLHRYVVWQFATVAEIAKTAGDLCFDTQWQLVCLIYEQSHSWAWLLVLT